MKIRQGKIKVLRLGTLGTEDEIDYMWLLTTSWRASGGSMLESWAKTELNSKVPR